MTKYLLAATVTAVLLVIAASAAWVASTTDGARWLMEMVSVYSPVKITAGRVEGRLLDHLRLTGVRVASGRLEAEADALDLRWSPFSLLSGRVVVKELAMSGVRIRDNSPPSPKPPLLLWPSLPAVFELVEGKIEALRVKGVTYRPPSGNPVTADSISASVRWRYRLLSLDNLAVATPGGSLKGKVAAGFSRPLLRTEIEILPAHPLDGIDSLKVDARFLPGRGLEQMAGKFAVSAGSASRKRLEISGEAGMSRHAMNFRGLRLTAPERRGTVTGEGGLDFRGPKPILKLMLKGRSLDLAPETGVTTDLSGRIDVVGNMDEYTGSFSVANRGKGWRGAAFSGGFRGNSGGVRLTPLEGRLLDGKVLGEVGIDWREGVSISGALSGSGLNPAGIDPEWKGVVNFALSGNLIRKGKSPLNWDINAKLRESRLHGRALTGEVMAGSIAGDIRIDRIVLMGRGFDIRGAGELKSRVNMSVRISDLSMLVPDTAGKLDGSGWMRWRNGKGSGSMSLRGTALSASGVSVASMELAARLDEGQGYPLHAGARLLRLSSKKIKADSANLEVDGTLRKHDLSAALFSSGAEARITLSGGYEGGFWRGDILRLSGRDNVGPWEMEGSSRLTVSSSVLSVSPIVIRGVGAERLEFAGELARETNRGDLAMKWGVVNLARASRWLKGADVTGSTSGNLQLHMPGAGRLALSGNATAAGTVKTEGKSVIVQHGAISLVGNERGVRAGAELHLADGGVLTGSFSTSAPARLAIPESGELRGEWRGFDLALLSPWLPGSVRVSGPVTGRANGNLLAGHRLLLSGQLSLSGGRAHWRTPDGEMKLEMRSASMSWNWREETLEGTFALSLAESGEAGGSFRLPIPARLPIVIDKNGDVRASVTANVREKGILTGLFPGVVRESSGDLDCGLSVSGRWDDPRITGKLHLDKAGGYLPTAGIHVKDLQLDAHLEKDQVRINSFRANSGAGRLEGSALISLKGWRVIGYRGKIDGEGFQTVHFPELQLSSTPHLTFEGTRESLKVRGELQIPEMRINGPPAGKVIGPSDDVIVEGRESPAAKKSPLALDVQVRLVLGDKVLVKAEGIDARLAGKMDLAFTSLDRITSRGEIRVVKGSYRTYGVNLDIVRGRLYYSGGPINSPTLDILALRTIGDVQAGVTVGGVLQEPVIKLYSTPSMSDADILSYIVLGHPLASARGSSQTDLLAQAAGALLSSSQATDLRGEIKSRLGLSTFGFETSSAKTTGSISYKAIPVAPRGVATSVPSASESLLTVGKYLTPQLYLSYGRSLFTGGNLFRLRYDIFKHWQIETQTGSESGGDVFFTIEFD